MSRKSPANTWVPFFLACVIPYSVPAVRRTHLIAVSFLQVKKKRGEQGLLASEKGTSCQRVRLFHTETTLGLCRLIFSPRFSGNKAAQRALIPTLASSSSVILFRSLPVWQNLAPRLVPKPFLDVQPTKVNRYTRKGAFASRLGSARPSTASAALRAAAACVAAAEARDAPSSRGLVRLKRHH